MEQALVDLRADERFRRCNGVLLGGIKTSGYGRELSFGLRELVNVKTVWIGSARQPALRSNTSKEPASGAAF